MRAVFIAHDWHFFKVPRNAVVVSLRRSLTTSDKPTYGDEPAQRASSWSGPLFQVTDTNIYQE
jgi:hypothetical protein